jgi:2-dehydro-3-deoxy-D-gluconate 5-dehydrogenase
MAGTLFDLTGKVALVTGARTGLGRAIASACASAGADIAGLGSQPMPETRQDVMSLGRRFAEVVVDLKEPRDYDALVAGVEAELGVVDVLVNNAGIIRRANLLEFSEADWDEVMAVNLKAVFLLSQAVARRMVANQVAGRIINIASVLSFQGGIRVPAYTAAKHGLAGLTRALANDLAPHGITVNAIAPGYMETDNTTALRNDVSRARQILDRIPAGRWGRPDDLAPAVLFLASSSSGYVTGTIVPVDGGWLSR